MKQILIIAILILSMSFVASAQKKFEDLLFLDTILVEGYLVIDKHKDRWYFLNDLPIQINTRSIKKKIEESNILFFETRVFKNFLFLDKNIKFDSCQNINANNYMILPWLLISERYSLIRIKDFLIRMIVSENFADRFFDVYNEQKIRKKNRYRNSYFAYTFKCWLPEKSKN